MKIENTDFSFICERNYKELSTSINNLSFLSNTTFQVGIDSSGISTFNLAQGYRYSQPIFSGNYVVLQHTKFGANYFTFTIKIYIIFLIFVGFCATYYSLKYADDGRLGWIEYAFIVPSSFFLHREPLISHSKTRSILYGFYLLSGLIALFGIAVFLYDLLEKQANNVYEYPLLNNKEVYTINGDQQASQIISKINAYEVDYTKYNNTSLEFLNYYDSQKTRFSIHKEYQALTLLSYWCDDSVHLINLPYTSFDGLIYNLSVTDVQIQAIDIAILQVLNKKSVQQRAREFQTYTNGICLATPADYIKFFYGIKYLDLWGLFLILWLLPLIWMFRKMFLSYLQKYHPQYYKEAKQEGILEVISYERAQGCGVLVDQEMKHLQNNIEQDINRRDEEGINPLVEYLLDDRQIPMEQIKTAYDKSKEIGYFPFRRLNSQGNESFYSSRSMGFKNPQRFKGFVKNNGDTSIQNFGGGFDSLMPTNQDGIEMTPLQDYFRLKFGQNNPDNNNAMFFQTLNRKHQNSQEGVGLIRMLSSIQPPNGDASALHDQIFANNSHDGSLQFGSLIQSDEEKKNRFRFNIVKQSRNQAGENVPLGSQLKISNLRNQNSLPLEDLGDDFDVGQDESSQKYNNQFQALKKQKSKPIENQTASKLRLKQNNFMDFDTAPSPQKISQLKPEQVINLEDDIENGNGHLNKSNINKQNSGLKSQLSALPPGYIPFEHKGKEHMFIRNIKRSHTGLNKLQSFVSENHEDIEKDFRVENPTYVVQPSAKQLLEELDQSDSSYRVSHAKKQSKILQQQKSIIDNFFDQQQTMVIKDNDLTVEVLTFRDDEQKEKDSYQIYDLDAHRNYSSNKSTNR